MSDTLYSGTSRISGDEKAVREFIEQFSTALTKNDATSIERMTAVGYTFVNPAGVVQDSEQRLAAIKSGDFWYQSVKYEEVNVRIYQRTAVVTALVIVKAKNKGVDANGKFRSTLTLIKMKGRIWQLVASQSNAVQSM